MPACITRLSQAIDNRWLTNKCVESTRFMRSISFCRAFGARVGRALEPSIADADSRHLTLRIFKLNGMTARFEQRHRIRRETALQLQHVGHPLMMQARSID